MNGFKISQELTGGAYFSAFGMFHALLDALVRAGPGGDAKETLIGFSVLSD